MRQIRGPRDAGVSSGTNRLDAIRRLAPEETIARVKRFAPAFGITRVANLTGLDRTGIPVVMVCRPNARSSAVFNGKGVDVASAQASALMEAAETWHAENIRLPLQFASFADLEGQFPVIDVDGLPRTPTPQFDPHLPILWVEGRNLMDDSAIWLPFEIVHAEFEDVGSAAQRLLRDEHQWACFGQSLFGGGEPRPLRGHRTRRDQPLASKPAR